MKVVNTLMASDLNGKVEKNERCCGESGTFAVARPDISTQVRFRKEEEMRKGVMKIRSAVPEAAVVTDLTTTAQTTTAATAATAVPVKILTSCPSCLQGLSRYNDDVGVEADYIVVEIAKHLLGEDWLPEYVKRANAGGIERVLV
jgi:Fe-S oxidoreductase